MDMELTNYLFKFLREARERSQVPDVLATEEFDFLVFVLKRLGMSRSQISQDLWVLYETNFKRQGYFVEFGAADGLKWSNTYILEKSFGWSGIVAEPNPVFHEALRRHRQCYISTKCVTGRSGERVE